MPLEPMLSRAEGPNFRVCHQQIDLRTQERLQFIDISELVADRVRRSGVVHGLVHVQTRHTTTAIVVNENEPLLIEDLKTLMERLAPRAAAYRHDDLAARRAPVPLDERPNGHAHARAVALGGSQTLNVVDGQIHLGRWQRIFLVELDGRRKRSVSITILGLAGDETTRRQSHAPAAAARLKRIFLRQTEDSENCITSSRRTLAFSFSETGLSLLNFSSFITSL